MCLLEEDVFDSTSGKIALRDSKTRRGTINDGTAAQHLTEYYFYIVLPKHLTLGKTKRCQLQLGAKVILGSLAA